MNSENSSESSYEQAVLHIKNIKDEHNPIIDENIQVRNFLFFLVTNIY